AVHVRINVRSLPEFSLIGVWLRKSLWVFKISTDSPSGATFLVSNDPIGIQIFLLPTLDHLTENIGKRFVERRRFFCCIVSKLGGRFDKTMTELMPYNIYSIVIIVVAAGAAEADSYHA